MDKIINMGLNFIQWSFNAELINEPTVLNNNSFLDFTADPTTKTKNGILIRFDVQFSSASPTDIAIGCKAHQIFFCSNLSLLNFQELKEIVNYSFDNFSYEFQKRARREGFIIGIDNCFQDYDIDNLLGLLKS